MLRGYAGRGQTTLEVRERHVWPLVFGGVIGAVLVSAGVMAASDLGLGAVFILLIGCAMLWYAGYGATRCRHVALTLGPDGILFAGARHPLRWETMTDFSFQEGNGLLTVTVRLQGGSLPPSPEVLGRRARYLAKGNIARFTLWGIKGISSRDFATRLHEGWLGALARAELKAMGAALEETPGQILEQVAARTPEPVASA